MEVRQPGPKTSRCGQDCKYDNALLRVREFPVTDAVFGNCNVLLLHSLAVLSSTWYSILAWHMRRVGCAGSDGVVPGRSSESDRRGGLAEGYIRVECDSALGLDWVPANGDFVRPSQIS